MRHRAVMLHDRSSRRGFSVESFEEKWRTFETAVCLENGRVPAIGVGDLTDETTLDRLSEPLMEELIQWFEIRRSIVL